MSTKKIIKRKKTVAKKSVAKIVEKKIEPKVLQQIEKQFVFVGSCGSCEHLPMPVNALVAVLTVAVIILSGIVIVQSKPIPWSSSLARVSGAPFSIDQTFLNR